jgi:hypothetical protein
MFFDFGERKKKNFSTEKDHCPVAFKSSLCLSKFIFHFPAKKRISGGRQAVACVARWYTFKPKNSTLDNFWMVLQYKMWYCLWPIWYIFSLFWYGVPRKIWQPWPSLADYK